MSVFVLVLAACGAPEEEAPEAPDADPEPVEDVDADEEEAPEDEEASACPEGYPEQDIRFIIPFSPGGGGDSDFRRVESHVEDYLGVTVSGDQNPGAGGTIGFAELAHSAPDGYTLSTMGMPHALLPTMMGDPGYEFEQLRPIAITTQAPHMLYQDGANPAFEDFEAFEQHVLENPGQTDLTGAGEFNMSHVMQAQLFAAGLETNWVAHGEGAAGATADIRGGHFPAGITTLQQYLTGDGEVGVLAVATEERVPQADYIPTFQELGYDIVAETTWGFMAPADTPDEIVWCLYEAWDYALQQDDVIEAAVSTGHAVLNLNPDEAAEWIENFRGVLETVQPVLEEAAS